MKFNKIIKFIRNIILGILLFIIVLLAGFRISAYVRETKNITDLAPANGKIITTSLGNVHLQISGAENLPTVVLIHGTAAWSGFWRDVMDNLVENNFRVIAIDLPPFGFSEASPDAKYTHKDQAIRIHEVLEKLQIKDAIIVGHSFGSGPAVETIMEFPEQIKGLVLVSPALGLPENNIYPSTLSPSLNWLLHNKLVSQTIISTFITNPLFTKIILSSMLFNKSAADSKQAKILHRPMNLSGSTENYAKWLPVFLNFDKSAMVVNPDNYSRIKIPVAIVWGGKDKITPLSKADQIRKLLPQATFNLMPNVGHLPHIEDAASFKKILVSELKRIRYNNQSNKLMNLQQLEAIAELGDVEAQLRLVQFYKFSRPSGRKYEFKEDYWRQKSEIKKGYGRI